MTGDRRALRTGRSGKFFPGPVIVLQKAILDTDEMRALPANATKLLLSILPQYNGPGSNNGAIRILMRQPRRYGFKSGATLTQARDDLRQRAWQVGQTASPRTSLELTLPC
jgi:hypothetical protein